MLEKLFKDGGLYLHEWEYGGKSYEADYKIEVKEGNKKEIQITIDQKNNKSAICLFNEEYDLNEFQQFMLDLENQNLEFVIDKLDQIFL
jgi:hypothetical protein